VTDQGVLHERGRALEEAFFRQRAEEYRDALKLRQEEVEAREALAEASGITDEAVLTRLAGLGIRADTLAALTLIPLVEVAWADGRMEEKEQRAVLSGAESTGVEPGSPSHGLLCLWLEDRPPPDLVTVWADFVAALCRDLEAGERRKLADRILERSLRVAEAAGGFLGLTNPVSEQEKSVLEKLREAFTR
jgi:hypothetical protein